ncbi:MAG: leucine-rich repeat domain-containing protein, partial [Candidatus Saccharimonadales bacterium]
VSGTIPSLIFTPSLIYLDLSSTGISGTIPSQVSLATSLTNLRLQSSSITGDLPSSLGVPSSFPSLIYLTLANNDLSCPNPLATNYSWVATNDFALRYSQCNASCWNSAYNATACYANRGLCTALTRSCSCIAGFVNSPPYWTNCAQNVQEAALMNWWTTQAPNNQGMNFFPYTTPLCVSTLGNYNFAYVVCSNTSSSVSASITSISIPNTGNQVQFNVTLPDTWTVLTSLTNLYIGQSFNFDLGGPNCIPNYIWSLPSLTYIFISSTAGSCMLQFDNTSFVGSVLTHIELHGTGLYGTIPSSIGSLSTLQTLVISSVLMNGTIPSELFQLPALRSIFITNNLPGGGPATQFSGPLPAVVPSNATQSITISNTLISGTIPSQIAQSPGMQSLTLSSNQLSGSLPASLFESTTITYISVSQNLLSGEMPQISTGTSFALVNLDLHSNLLSGPIIETFFMNMPFIQTLDLHNNSFSGPIPMSLWSSASLVNIYLQNNQFSGPMPTTFVGAATPYANLYLAGNNLGCFYPYNATNNDWATFNASCQANCPYMPSQSACDIVDGNAFCPANTGGCSCAYDFVNTTMTPNCANTADTLSFLEWWSSLNSTAPYTNLPQNVYDRFIGNYYASGCTLVSCASIFSVSAQTESNTQVITENVWTAPGQILTFDTTAVENMGATVALVGTFPTQLGSWVNLEIFRLGGPPSIFNPVIPPIVNITGTIPSSITGLTELSHLALVANRVSGTLPVQLASLPSLQTIYIDSTQITGPLSPALFVNQTFYYLVLANSTLTGTLPPIESMCTLVFANNMLTGTIPSNFMTDFSKCTNQQATQLRLARKRSNNPGPGSTQCTLDLTNNALYGDIPSGLFST